VYGLFAPGLFRIDRQGLVRVGLLGGALVALFEVAYQFAIQGVGVAGAATLLYTAPIMVAVLAWPLLGERLTLTRLALAVVVLVGVALTVSGQVTAGEAEAAGGASRAAGIVGGRLSAAGFAGSTLLARRAVPRFGAVRVLFSEIGGGTAVLGVGLTRVGAPPVPCAPLGGRLRGEHAARPLGAALLRRRTGALLRDRRGDGHPGGGPAAGRRAPRSARDAARLDLHRESRPGRGAGRQLLLLRGRAADRRGADGCGGEHRARGWSAAGPGALPAVPHRQWLAGPLPGGRRRGRRLLAGGRVGLTRAGGGCGRSAGLTPAGPGRAPPSAGAGGRRAARG